MRRVHLEPPGAADDPAVAAALDRLAPDPADTSDPAVAPDAPDGLGDALVDLSDLVVQAARAGATALVLEAEPAPTALDEAAAAQGFEVTRTTLQLRCPLPVPPERRGAVEAGPGPTFRAFQLGRDEGPWLDVNNRAFAWHPDQSNRTSDDLAALEAEPWLRTDGFLVHDGDDGRLDGFCWTKIHDRHDPPLGEIYVIGVDPARHGRGLGRALVLAGLDWLAGQGLADGMLYVEADNQPALHLYRSLGFVEHHRHRWWRWAIDRPHDPGPDPR